MKPKFISMLLAVAMLLGTISATVFAAEPACVLAIGDSISAGYGVGEGEVFTALFGDEYSVNNRAVNGNTVPGLLKQFQNEDITVQEIKAADIVTVTIGGNDIMAVFYNEIANMYNETNDPDITSDEVAEILANLSVSNILKNLPIVRCAQKLLDETDTSYLMNTDAFKSALENLSSGINALTLHIGSLNPDAHIIMATQYNPYIEFEDAELAGMVSLTPIYKGIEDGIGQLNDVIKNNSQSLYTVADVKSAFDAVTDVDLFNASPALASISLDFHPNAAGHALLAETFLAHMNGENKVFDDVHTAGHWAIKDIDYVCSKGLMNGTSEDAFSPDGKVTRAMLVTVLYRNEGEPATNRSIPFADIDMASYYADAVIWAKQNRIVNGVTETEFAPDDYITREQIASIMFRYAQYKGVNAVTLEENLHFDDANSISEYAVPAMNWAVGAGLMKGKTSKALNPQDNATRAEMAAILHRFIEAE